MINDILKKSQTFNIVCLCVGIVLLIENYDSPIAWGILLGFLLGVLFEIYKAKKPHENVHISQVIWTAIEESLAWLTIWICAYFFIISDYNIPKDHVIFFIIFFIIYFISCFVVSAFDSTNYLSPSKITIASVFLTPVVMYLLLKYNNKHSKEEAEKNLERASRCIEEKEYPEAIRVTTEAIEICPKNKEEKYLLTKCYYMRGKAYALNGESDKAKDDYRVGKTLGGRELSEDDPVEKRILFKTGEYMAYLNKKIQENPNDGYPHSTRANLYIIGMSDDEDLEGWYSHIDAIVDCEKAIECDNQDAKAYACRGWLIAKYQKDYDTAIDDCTKAIELASKIIAKKQEDNDAAIADNTEEIDYTGEIRTLAYAYKMRSEVYEMQGDTEKAHADYEKVESFDVDVI